MKYLVFLLVSGKAEKAYWKHTVESEEGKAAEFVCAFAESFFGKKFMRRIANLKKKYGRFGRGGFYRKTNWKSEERRLRFPAEAGL